jgi:hypothetical protein
MTSIVTDAEFESACDQLDTLWSARPGDKDWDRRCEIIKHLDEYEKKHGKTIEKLWNHPDSKAEEVGR